jgi:hypothetical protein
MNDILAGHDPVMDAVRSVLLEIGVSDADILAEPTLLNVVTDEDLTFWFVPSIEKRLGVRVPPNEWAKVHTISDAVQVLRRQV